MLVLCKHPHIFMSLYLGYIDLLLVLLLLIVKSLILILINDHQNLERGALTVIDVSDEANGPLMEHNIFASHGFTIQGHSALLEGRKPLASEDGGQ